jgi:hypothetical protein
VCFQAIHKKGKRAKHSFRVIDPDLARRLAAGPQRSVVPASGSHAVAESPAAAAAVEEDDAGANMDEDDVCGHLDYDPRIRSEQHYFVNRAKHIPLRLTIDERKHLRLLEACLNVSEYTDKVDILYAGNKKKRIFTQLQDICAILSGLVVACDYELGKKMLDDREFKDNEEFFRAVFEVRDPLAFFFKKFESMNSDESFLPDWATVQDYESGENAKRLRQAALRPDGLCSSSDSAAARFQLCA